MAQAFQNRLIALVLAMVVAIPLVAAPLDARWTGVASLTYCSFALLLAVMLVWRAQWNPSRERVTTFLKTGANTPVLLFAGLVLASGVFAPNKLFAANQVIQIMAGVLLYFVVAYQFRQSKHMSMLADTLMFLAAAVSLITMAQYAMDASLRGTALYGNQQPLGSLLMILLPMVAVVALSEKQLSNRQIAAQVITVMTAGSLLLAQTRSAWIGAFAALVMLAGLALSTAARDSKRVRGTQQLGAQKHKIVMPLMLAVVALGFVGIFASQNGSFAQRAASFSNLGTDYTFQHRAQSFWAGAWEMVKDHAAFGVGPGQYALQQHAYTGQGESAMGVGVRGSLAENAHNFYLQTAAELGIPGVILFVAILGAFMVSGVSRVNKMDAGIRRTLLMGSIAAIVAFSLDAMSSPSWQFGQVAMFFWMILGAGVGCMRPRAKHEEEEAVPVLVKPRVMRPAIAVLAGIIFMTVILPVSTLTAQASHGYNHDNDDNDFFETFLLIAGLAGLGYLLFNNNTGGAGTTSGDQTVITRTQQEPTVIIPAPQEPAIIR
jgi:putative inorganic carbon (HCO3(-)) transporter